MKGQCLGKRKPSSIHCEPWGVTMIWIVNNLGMAQNNHMMLFLSVIKIDDFYIY